MTPILPVIRMVRIRVQRTTAFPMFLLLVTNRTSVFSTLLTIFILGLTCPTWLQRLIVPRLLAITSRIELVSRQLYLSAVIVLSRPRWSKPSIKESEGHTPLAIASRETTAADALPTTLLRVPSRVPPCSQSIIVPSLPTAMSIRSIQCIRKSIHRSIHRSIHKTIHKTISKITRQTTQQPSLTTTRPSTRLLPSLRLPISTTLLPSPLAINPSTDPQTDPPIDLPTDPPIALPTDTLTRPSRERA